MTYATVEDVERGFRPFDADDKFKCEALLDEIAVRIDLFNKKADEQAKWYVSIQMARRIIGAADSDSLPLGATQGSVSAMGYSQSWTLGGGSGEQYFTAEEKKMLGGSLHGNRIGSKSPLEFEDD